MNRRSRKDSDSAEVPDFLFVYADSDSLNAELAEWYAYSEEPEFVWNANAFKNNLFKKYHGEKKWRELTRNERRTHVMRLLEQADSSSRQKREAFYRSILYIAQGVFQECETINDYNQSLVENIALLYECDVFNVFTELFIFEANEMCQTFNAENKYAPCITDNADLRVILSVLYTMLEVIRCYDKELADNRLMPPPPAPPPPQAASGSSSSTSFSSASIGSQKELLEKYAQMREQLKSDLNRPLEKTNELFSVYLFQLISKFCNHNIIVLPIKKIILLLWKSLLFTLGGLDEAFRLKNELRTKFGLDAIIENPSLILAQMTPATPPPNPVDLVNELQFANPNSSYKRKKNGLTKQTRGIDSDDMVTTISNSVVNNSNGRLTQFGFSQTSGGNNGSVNNTATQSASSESLPSSAQESDSRERGAEDGENGNGLMENGNDTANSIDEVRNEELAAVAAITDSLEAAISANDEVVSSTTSFDSSSDIGDETANSQELSTIIETRESSESDSISSSSTYEGSGRSGSPTPSTTSEDSTMTSGSTDSTSTSASSTANKESLRFRLTALQQLKCLPWQPKVRTCELEAFLDQERKKFLGYGDLAQDLDTLVGLPYPIHESVRILKQHLFMSLGDEQIKLEDRFTKYPMSTRDPFANNDSQNVEQPPAEILFAALLNNLPQYLICLLKILLTSVPQTRAKNDSLQIMSDLFPEELSGSHFLNVKLGIDTNRHKEILIKAISAILLLMLKHFKVNHIYQFEFMSQHLLFANCIPLILKFFNLNISSFIQSKNNHFQLDFPNCVIGEQPELDADELENGDSSIFRWRNVFSCINLLRILNKLTKYKRSRVMMLVIFKSAPILKKVLRIKQAMLQYYALKLIKMQTRHLGRQWRKTNMGVMSAIYQKVRHRLGDDWAFGNEQEAQGWDFQSDECALRTRIDKFNQRRYRNIDEPLNPDFLPNESSLFTSLRSGGDSFGSSITNGAEMPENFATNYESWLNEEVFSNKINWDLLLDHNSNSYILF